MRTLSRLALDLPAYRSTERRLFFVGALIAASGAVARSHRLGSMADPQELKATWARELRLWKRAGRSDWEFPRARCAPSGPRLVAVERGATNISLQNTERIASALRLTTSELLRHAESLKSPSSAS